MTNTTTTAARKLETFTCPKCSGKGVLTYHLNVDNGRCFQCGGAGRVTIDTTPAKIRKPAPWTRAKAIDYCAMIVRTARALGDRDSFLDEGIVTGIDMERCMAAFREDGFDDVATRCEAAVCKALGVTLENLHAAARR